MNFFEMGFSKQKSGLELLEVRLPENNVFMGRLRCASTQRRRFVNPGLKVRVLLAEQLSLK